VILTPGTVLRLAALVLTGVVLQLSAVSEVTILGSNADLTPLIPLSVGLLAGSIPGAVVGFFTGLVFDMALVQTLGVTSLLLTGLGYLAGRYRELRDTSNALLVPAAGAIGTLAYAIALSIIQFLLGLDSSVSSLVVRDIFVNVVLNTAIAVPVFAGVRALIRVTLSDHYRPRRRPTRGALRVPTG